MKDKTEDVQLKNDNHGEQKIKSFNTGTNKDHEVILSTKVRWFVFIILFVITTLVNMDHGTVPAATKDIKEDLKIDDNILGIFGSLVFLGNLFGIIYKLTF